MCTVHQPKSASLNQTKNKTFVRFFLSELLIDGSLLKVVNRRESAVQIENEGGWWTSGHIWPDQVITHMIFAQISVTGQLIIHKQKDQVITDIGICSDLCNRSSHQTQARSERYGHFLRFSHSPCYKVTIVAITWSMQQAHGNNTVEVPGKCNFIYIYVYA